MRLKSGWPLLAIGLWLPTLALSAWRIAHTDRSTHASIPGDDREAIRVSPEERSTILGTMNENLLALHRILKALADDDLAAVAKAADSAARAPGPGARLQSLREVLPDPWRRSGKIVHKEFARVARLAERGATSSDLIPRMSRLTRACVDCHNTYRLVPADRRRDP